VADSCPKIAVDAKDGDGPYARPYYPWGGGQGPDRHAHHPHAEKMRHCRARILDTQDVALTAVFSRPESVALFYMARFGD
jgi:hypothetical protein